MTEEEKEKYKKIQASSGQLYGFLFDFAATIALCAWGYKNKKGVAFYLLAIFIYSMPFALIGYLFGAYLIAPTMPLDTLDEK